jgi:uncharacterized protein (DUF1330 family)
MSQGSTSEAGVQGKGYWIVLSHITDPSGFGPYQSAAMPVIASFGGRAIARGDVSEVVEGSVSGRPYLIEFSTFASAKACFSSEKYQQAIALRSGIAQFNIVIVEGVQST